MAKALYGHVASSDARLAWDNDRLRSRIAELEAEVARLTRELNAPAKLLIQELSMPDPLADAVEFRPVLA